MTCYPATPKKGETSDFTTGVCTYVCMYSTYIHTYCTVALISKARSWTGVASPMLRAAAVYPPMLPGVRCGRKSVAFSMLDSRSMLLASRAVNAQPNRPSNTGQRQPPKQEYGLTTKRRRVDGRAPFRDPSDQLSLPAIVRQISTTCLYQTCYHFGPLGRRRWGVVRQAHTHKKRCPAYIRPVAVLRTPLLRSVPAAELTTIQVQYSSMYVLYLVVVQANICTVPGIAPPSLFYPSLSLSIT